MMRAWTEGLRRGPFKEMELAFRDEEAERAYRLLVVDMGIGSATDVVRYVHELTTEVRRLEARADAAREQTEGRESDAELLEQAGRAAAEEARALRKEVKILEARCAEAEGRLARERTEYGRRR